MLLVIGVLFVGMLAGVLFERSGLAHLIFWATRVVMPAVMLLLVLMGLSVGLHPSIVSNLGTLSIESLVLALGAMVGSVALAPIANRIAYQPIQEVVAPLPAETAPWKTTIQIAVSFVFGALMSIPLRGNIEQALVSQASEYSLLFLLFVVGITVGADRPAWKILRRARLTIFVVPLLFILGSLVGAALVSAFFLKISIREAVGVGAGMGYYSLSSVLITKLAGPRLGVVALLANVLREILTLVLAPHFVKRFGPMASIASGGATAMDTTLPIVILVSGKEYAFYAVFSGVLLTLAVPFLVSLIFSI